MDNTLIKYNIPFIYHVSPLHYLIFYIRSKKLLSKSELIKLNYDQSHFRSTSKNVDLSRGFNDVIHCTNRPFPPILISKLNKGYQHMEICLRTDTLQEQQFLLCKYNIAKNRGLFTESLCTGRCYNDYKIPVAISPKEKNAMLSSIKNYEHIEVLLNNSLPLDRSVIFRFFSTEDAELASKYFMQMEVNWEIQIINHSFKYDVDKNRKIIVEDFLERAFSDINWKGNGLEFDR